MWVAVRRHTGTLTRAPVLILSLTLDIGYAITDAVTDTAMDTVTDTA